MPKPNSSSNPSKREEVVRFFHTVCQDPSLQNQLKAPCPANRSGFAQVAQAKGYNLTGADLDGYVRFYQFYREFQGALDQHPADAESLAKWLRKWEKHVGWFTQHPLTDHQDTIRRYYPVEP